MRRCVGSNPDKKTRFAKEGRARRDGVVFTAAKDALASQAARTYVNGLIKRYGELRELKIDSRAKTVHAVCGLIGETEPVTVNIEAYRMVTERETTYVEITACSCSRGWLQNLLEDQVCGRRLKLPAWAAAAL